MYSQLIIKKADIILQTLAIVIPMVGTLLNDNTNWIPYIYFSLGAVQAASCFLNARYKDEFTRAGSRRAYERTLLVLTVLVGITMLLSLSGFYAPLFIMMVVMALAGIVLGIWYLYISIREMTTLERLEERKRFQ